MEVLDKHSQFPKPTEEGPESEKQRMRRLLKEFFDEWAKRYPDPD